jgi:DNA polymerase III delta prime subunit
MNKETLLWERFRPHKINNMILLPRIKDFLKDGIKTNLILYGSPGLGKTTLAKILCADNPTLEINSSYFTSIDVLRSTITDFIKTLSFDYDPNKMKIIFLDEFERVSPQYQDALKGYIEEYADSARFILTTNHINKIEELGSRFNKVNFNPINQSETDYLKGYYFKYLKAIVNQLNENDLITDDVIYSIINKFFPDLRAAVQMIDEIRISRNVSIISTSASSSYFVDFYNFMLSGKNDTIENYKYVMNNYSDNPEAAFDVLGRSFFEYIINNLKNIDHKKLAKIVRLQKNYNETLNQTIDPVIHLLSYIFDLKLVINE